MASSPPSKIPVSRILTAGLLALALSIAVNVAALFVIEALLPIAPEFPPMSPGPIAFFTTIGVVGATIAFIIVSRLARNIVRVYGIVVIVALALSVIPDIMLAVNPERIPLPGATPLAALALIVFHVITSAICYWSFTRIAPSSVEGAASP